MEYFAVGGSDIQIDEAQAGELLDQMLATMAPLKRVLLVPPDMTRYQSWSGTLTCLLYERLKGSCHIEIMPALGTHVPMTAEELDKMFPGVPHDLFKRHDWRNSLVQLGAVPAEFIREVSEGRVEFPVQVAVNRLLVDGNWDRIISIGQLVPHEVIGIANQNKNIFVGVGGGDSINKTHYLGAVYGMERIMGRAQTPVRAVLNYAEEHFAQNLPITYLLTVRGKDEAGKLVTRGLFAGDGQESYLKGAELARKVNLTLLDRPIQKAVVYLDPEEFKSTWLGNKSIYRTRMAIADDGDLIVLAPAVKEFGEDKEIDRLIRKYGYRGTPHTIQQVEQNEELQGNLSAAAHLIHGSSEGRFRITYCTGKLTREEVEGVGFQFGNLDAMLQRYNPEKLRDGWVTLPDGEEIFYVSNPGQGLWSQRQRFE